LPEKGGCGGIGRDKKIKSKKILPKELTRLSRLDILDKCLREGRDEAPLGREPNLENIIV